MSSNAYATTFRPHCSGNIGHGAFGLVCAVRTKERKYKEDQIEDDIVGAQMALKAIDKQKARESQRVRSQRHVHFPTIDLLISMRTLRTCIHTTTGRTRNCALCKVSNATAPSSHNSSTLTPIRRIYTFYRSLGCAVPSKTTSLRRARSTPVPANFTSPTSYWH